MTRLIHSSGNAAIVVVILAIALFATTWTPGETDEVPAFFLKIAKNIPRVGRSGPFDDSFFKSVKNLPRIARREQSPKEALFVHGDAEPFNSPTKRMFSVPIRDDATWSHFPLAIEGPPELWRALAGYTTVDSGYGADAIDNEIWQRDKRTGDVAAMV